MYLNSKNKKLLRLVRGGMLEKKKRAKSKTYCITKMSIANSAKTSAK